jgi:hypothetical protein
MSSIVDFERRKLTEDSKNRRGVCVCKRVKRTFHCGFFTNVEGEIIRGERFLG